MALSGDCGIFYFLKKKISKPSYIYVFHRKNSNFHNSRMVDHGKLPYPKVNSKWHFDISLTGLKETLSFKWPDFGLKSLVTISPKVQSLKFKYCVWNFPFSKRDRNFNSLFRLADSKWVVITEQKRKVEYSWACTFRAS